MIKNTDTTNQYLEHIRETHDPSMHLKTIEDELRGTMGKALGKQGEKIRGLLLKMSEEKTYYDRLLADEAPAVKIRKSVVRYNEYWSQAHAARWELIVHRQAVGFLVDNHSTVQRHFPIPSKLEYEEDGDKSVDEVITDEDKCGTSKFGTQLDWWQRVGRWR